MWGVANTACVVFFFFFFPSFQKVLLVITNHCHSKVWQPIKKKETKDSAGSDDTASMFKGGGYIGARTRQPPTAQAIRKKLMWVRGVVCRSTQTQSLTVVACVIPCFMSADACLMKCSFSLCVSFSLMVIQVKVCQRFVCIVFVDRSHSSNADHVELDFPISLSV